MIFRANIRGCLLLRNYYLRETKQIIHTWWRAFINQEAQPSTLSGKRHGPPAATTRRVVRRLLGNFHAHISNCRVETKYSKTTTVENLYT